MSKTWSVEDIAALGRSFQPACVLAAAADLDLFTAIGRRHIAADALATELACDLRGLRILLDALAALGLLDKHNERYSVPASLQEVLTPYGKHSLLAMTQHQANCLRRWAQLARVVKTGQLPPRQDSIRGREADQESFITAMDNISAPVAQQLIDGLPDLPIARLLDVGGASGTWTIAFLRRFAQAQATLFDLPHVIPLAKQRVEAAGLLQRVSLVAGDFYSDALPGGVDLVWISAIVHQNSRAQNRDLFAKAASALADGGLVLIRDVVMEEARTEPAGGALFAVNMLSATATGGTFTFHEFKEDLQQAGFGGVQLLRKDPWMNSLVLARKG